MLRGAFLQAFMSRWQVDSLLQETSFSFILGFVVIFYSGSSRQECNVYIFLYVFTYSKIQFCNKLMFLNLYK